MRRIFLLFAVLAALLAAPAAIGRGAPPADGTLSVKRGKGVVSIQLRRGTVIGLVAKGSVQIKDFRPYDANYPQFVGCKKKKQLNVSTTLCEGKNVSFRALDGRYNVSVRGSGINLSVVGKGQVTLDGTGESGLPDGVMSLNGGAYESLPDVPTTYQLAAPSPGG